MILFFIYPFVIGLMVWSGVCSLHDEPTGIALFDSEIIGFMDNMTPVSEAGFQFGLAAALFAMLLMQLILLVAKNRKA